MRPRITESDGSAWPGLGALPRRRLARREEDNSQAAVLRELGLTLGEFLAVFLAAIWIARALGAG